jgi:CTD small phosphatase-like protein 2
VLDLDETLLHFEELSESEGQLSIRPGADQFLKLMARHFEVCIFTAGTEEYADWALNFLESVSCISHRMYRQHALPYNGFYVKDLSRVGRDLSKTIIVDNIADNF